MREGRLDHCLTAAAVALTVLAWPISPFGLKVLLDSGLGTEGMLACAMAAFVSLALCLWTERWRFLALRSMAGRMPFLALAAAAVTAVLTLPFGSLAVTPYVSIVYGLTIGGVLGLTVSRFLVAWFMGSSDTSFRTLRAPIVAFACLLAATQLVCLMGLPLHAVAHLMAACLVTAATCALVARNCSYPGADGSARQDKNHGESSDSAKPLLNYFVGLGFGISCYIGVPLIMTIQDGSMSDVPSPWLFSVLGISGLTLVALPLVNMLLDRQEVFAYGRMVRDTVLPMTLLVLAAVIVLSHNPELGALLATVPPVAAIGVTVLVIDQTYIESTQAQKLSSMLFLIVCAIVGLIAGIVVLVLLWMVEDTVLRFQLLSMPLVATCLISVHRVPRRAATARDLLCTKLPEDMSRGERRVQACDSIAERGEFTIREREVLSLLISGIPQKEIAYNLGIGLKTAQNHVSHIYMKLGVHSVSELMLLVGDELE